MTLFEPTLEVLRLVIERNNRAVYNESFHRGVNIIRGENSSGKSTILNSIFYGLGGDLRAWSEAALLCTRVIVEVSVNGLPATLSRDISAEPGQSLDVFGGPYELAVRAPRAEWIRYPYRRSQSRESFSQALFRLLGIPEVAGEATGNLTMHQILRLLYADQLSPVESLFRFEGPFDSPTIRVAVGRLLCGAFDSQLYNNELRIRDLAKELEAATAELRSLFAVLGQTGESLTLDWIAGQRRVLEEQRQKVQSAIELAEQQRYTSTADDTPTLNAQKMAYEVVQKAQIALTEARQQRDALSLEIADSNAFIASLEGKLSSLHDASATADEFDKIRFHYCPACYAPIETDPPPHACHLCKTPFDTERAKTRIVALINDTAIQLKQSRQLQENRLKQAAALDEKLRVLEDHWRRVARRLAELQRLPSTEREEHLRDLQRQSGYIERQLDDLAEKTRLVAIVEELSSRKVRLSEEIARLKSDNEKMQLVQQQRLERAYTLIADEVRYILRRDLRRQDSFEDAEKIEFDFAANHITVDGQNYFSASSRVILKNSFYLGFLTAATKERFFRDPRFCMIDTVEDKGIEPVRSHNFQLLMAEMSEECKVEHQIIFATSMIAPDLDDERYTIGKFSTRDDMTLDLRG
jgi:hypothetical protein